MLKKSTNIRQSEQAHCNFISIIKFLFCYSRFIQSIFNVIRDITSKLFFDFRFPKTFSLSSRLGSNSSLMLVLGREGSPMTSFDAETDLKRSIIIIIKHASKKFYLLNKEMCFASFVAFHWHRIWLTNTIFCLLVRNLLMECFIKFYQLFMNPFFR